MTRRLHDPRQSDREVRERAGRRRHGPHGAQDHRGHVRRLREPRRRRASPARTRRRWTGRRPTRRATSRRTSWRRGWPNGARSSSRTRSAMPEPVSIMVGHARHGGRDGRGARRRRAQALRPPPARRSSNGSSCGGPSTEQTAAYGHFGREEPDFTWERLDMVGRARNGQRRKEAEMRHDIARHGAAPGGEGQDRVGGADACRSSRASRSASRGSSRSRDGHRGVPARDDGNGEPRERAQGAGGARVALCASNPLSTQDDVAALCASISTSPSSPCAGRTTTATTAHHGRRSTRTRRSRWTTARISCPPIHRERADLIASAPREHGGDDDGRHPAQGDGRRTGASSSRSSP